MNIKVVNLKNKFDSFSEYWNPKIVGELNEQLVKVVKLKGEFVFHKHENEDEMFYVIEGKLKMALDQNKTLNISAGEFVIIPKRNKSQTNCCWRSKSYVVRAKSYIKYRR